MGEHEPTDDSRDPAAWRPVTPGHFGAPLPRDQARTAVAPVPLAPVSEPAAPAAAMEPEAASPAASMAAPPAAQEEAPPASSGPDGLAPGAVVDDNGEQVPAEWREDDPRFARVLVTSRKQLAAADIVRGRNTWAAAEAISEFPGEIPDDTWSQRERTHQVRDDLMQRGRADMKMARLALDRIGFATYVCDGSQDAFLAVGWSPDTIESVAEWRGDFSSVAGWLFDGGPDVGGRRKADCYAEEVTIGAFRDLLPVQNSSKALLLRVDAIESHDATEADTVEGYMGRQERHPADVTWHVRVPASLKLAPGETARSLREHVPQLPETMRDLWDTWDAVGDDLEGFVSALENHRAVTSDDPTQAPSVPQLVKGLLPAGMVVVLVGESGSGKSTLAHQLAAAIGGRAAEFLGYEIPQDMRGGGVAIVAGEDTKEGILTRARRFFLAGFPYPRAIALKTPTRGAPLAETLADLERVPNLRLVVVDPAATWLAGKDEDAAGAVGEFLGQLTDFGQRTGACVVVTHHPRKGRGFTLGQLLDAIRGSGRWIDLPRVVLGLAKAGGTLRNLGVIKSNLAPDIASHSVRLEGDEESTLWRRADAPTGGTAGGAKAAQVQPESDARAVLAAVAALRAAGERVNRTGDRSLHKRQPPPLPGWSRKRISAGEDSALHAGLLVEGLDGLAVPD